MKQQKQPKIRSRSDLEKICHQVSVNAEENSVRIVVGLGTCGVAAGARQVFDAMQQEIARLGLAHVRLVSTGCVGICQFEPVVEVYMPGQSRTTYVKMTPERAIRVVQQHIRGGNSLAEFTIGASQSGR
ncbi:MAG: (2Fe-2S) ferredoxin domain-containing protein [Lawsonibacter sp.]|nr:(2Fe-2S) ferredoxin domain-containing protein [Lawsonibacter sp.]